MVWSVPLIAAESTLCTGDPNSSYSTSTPKRISIIICRDTINPGNHSFSVVVSNDISPSLSRLSSSLSLMCNLQWGLLKPYNTIRNHTIKLLIISDNNIWRLCSFAKSRLCVKNTLVLRGQISFRLGAYTSLRRREF